MADGQVLIDSKLNVDGIEKGTKEIEQAMEKVADDASKAAKKIAKSFEDQDYKDAFDKLPKEAKKAYAQIEMIRSNDADDNKTKAEKIAAVYRELGDDQATAMKRAWDVVKDESAEGSHRVIEDLKEIGEKAEKAGKQIQKVGNGFKNVFGSDFMIHFLSDVAANAFDSLTDFIVDSAKEAVNAAAEISAANAMFEQTFKGVEKTARSTLQTISDETGIATTRMQTSFAKIFAFTKAVGGDTEKSMDIAARATRLAADNAAYFDTTVEEATETIYSFIKGNYENDAALNLVANEMARNAAANERYGKSFQELNGLQQADTLLAMAEAANELSGAYGQAAREASSWANVTGELKEAWKQFIAIFGESAIQTMTPVLQGITNALKEYVELRRELEEKNNPVKEEFEAVAEAAEPATEAIDEVTDAEKELAEQFQATKEAAQDSLESTMGLFDELKVKSDLSAADIVKNLQSQQTALADYDKNLKKLVEMNYPAELVKQLADGSEKSMGYAQALASANDETVAQIIEKWNGLQQIEETTATTMAGIQTDLTVTSESVGGAVDQMISDVSEGSGIAAEVAGEKAVTLVKPVSDALAEVESSVKGTLEAIEGYVSESFERISGTIAESISGMDISSITEDIEALRGKLETLPTDVGGAVSGMYSESGTAAANALADAANTIQSTVFTPITESGEASGEAVGEAFDDAANTMKTAWGDTGPWFDANVASPVKTSIEGMGKSWETMESDTALAWENIVATVQSSVNQIQEAINSITGKTVYVNVEKTGSGASYISTQGGYDGQAYSPGMAAYTPATYDITPKIPYLATGAVIPPRAPFLAMLGDQMNGRNLEAPEELLRKIVREESGSAIEVETTVTFAGTLAQFVRNLFPEIKSEARRRGNSLAKEVFD